LNREGKFNSQHGHTVPSNLEIKPIAVAKAILPSSIQSLKLEVRNGSFVKPKNYHISDVKGSLTKIIKRNNSDIEEEK